MKYRKTIKKVTLFIFLIMIASSIIGGAYQYYKKPEQIVFISKSTNPQFVFWETVRMGAELAAKEENIEIKYVGPLEEKEIDEQISLMKQCIEDKVDIIILAAAHSEKLRALVKEAIEKKITVITVDSTVENMEWMKEVATNNKEAARALTNYLVQQIHQNGEVIMLNFVQGTSTAIEREEGYEEIISYYPNILKRDTMYTEGTPESAYETTLEILTRYPNITGIIGANQYMTEGIILAVEAKGLSGKVKVVGFDGSPIIIKGIEKSTIDAVIIQKPFNMGYLAVKNAVRLFQHRGGYKDVDTGYKLITKDTLYSIENQKLLYPIIK